MMKKNQLQRWIKVKIKKIIALIISTFIILFTFHLTVMSSDLPIFINGIDNINDVYDDNIYKLTGNEINQIIKTMYQLIETIDDNEAKYNEDVSDLEQIIDEFEKLVIGLENEIALRDNLIVTLEEKNNTLKLSYDQYVLATELAEKNSNRTIELLEKRIMVLEDLNKEYKNKSSLNIITKLELIAMGIAISTIFSN